MGHQFVKAVRSKGKLYLYVAEEFSIGGKTIQKMIRRITHEEAERLGWKSPNSRAYSKLFTLLELPLTEENRAHEETILIRVWAEVTNPKAVVSPRQVSFEPGQVPAARFKLPIPAASSQPTIFIAIDSTCARRELELPVKDGERNGAKSSPIPENSKENETESL